MTLDQLVMQLLVLAVLRMMSGQIFEELVERHRQVKQEYEEQALASEQDIGRVAQIDYFINTLEEMDAPVTEFDDQLWISMVDHVVVHSKEDIRVVYRDGIEKNTGFLSNIIDVKKTLWYFHFWKKWKLFKGKLAEKQGRKARRG